MKLRLLLVLILAPCLSWSAPLVDISQIAGRTRADVAKVLGEPESTSRVAGGEKAVYRKGDVEVVFVKDRADWITVSAMGEVPFGPAALTSLGIKEAPPSFRNANVIRWRGIPGLLEVSVFPAGKNCDYAYIEVVTHPL